MIILFWGTKTREDTLGNVIDICLVCDDLRIFGVQERYQVTHFWFIPLGKMRLEAITRTCTICGTTLPCSPARYDRIIPVEIARTLGFVDLLAQTNRDIAHLYQDLN